MTRVFTTNRESSDRRGNQARRGVGVMQSLRIFAVFRRSLSNSICDGRFAGSAFIINKIILVCTGSSNRGATGAG